MIGHSSRLVAWTLAAAALGVAALALLPSFTEAQRGTPSASTPAAEGPRTLIEGLPTKMGRRVVSTLRRTHGAMPTVTDAVHTTRADGGEAMLIAYEYSAYDACVHAAPTRAEGRTRCRETTDRGCTEQRIAGISVGPTPAHRAEGTGGAIEVRFSADIRPGCRTGRVVTLEQGDFDGDGQSEMLADVVGETPMRDFRTSEPLLRSARRMVIFEADGTEALRLDLGEWGVESLEMETSSSAARWSWRPAPREGVAGRIALEEFEYADFGACRPDDTGWFTPAASDGDDYECTGDIERSVLHYDPSTSRWVP